MRFLISQRALLCALMAGLPSAGGPADGAEWTDHRTIDIFRIRSEFSLSDSEGHALLVELEQLREDVERLLGLEAAADPIEVNLFASRRSYQKFLSVRVPEGVARAALFVKGADMGRVYVHRHRDFRTDLRHECTHAVVHNALPYVPLWLDEGLAEYFEVPAPLRAGDNPHLKGVSWAMRLRWEPSLAGLEEKRDLSTLEAEDYRDSWAWVHFMLHGPPQPRQVLANYLYDIRSGNSAGQLSERMAHEVPGVETQLLRHFQEWE
jgi:hypothetical protein